MDSVQDELWLAMGSFYERFAPHARELPELAGLFRELERLGCGQFLLQPGQFAIYELLDPDTKAVRYVGATQHPERRALEHQRDGRGNAKKAAWVSELVAQGKRPLMRVLEVVQGGEAAAMREAMWIEVMSRMGFDLVNGTMAQGVGLPASQRNPGGISNEERQMIIRLYQEHDLSLSAICQRMGRPPAGSFFYTVRTVLEQEGILEQARKSR